MLLASTHNYGLFNASFTRVTELLDNPKDTKAAAAMFIEELIELTEDDLSDSVTVLAAAEVTDEDCLRDEIEYSFVVLTSPEAARWINDCPDSVFELEEIAR